MRALAGDRLAGGERGQGEAIGQGGALVVGQPSGQVVDIRWRYTAIETRAWETIIVPNSMLMKGQVELGAARVEVPARSLVNALREFQEHKRKRLDSPLSVTEWARLMVFFAVDHASGVKNLFKLPTKNGDQIIRLAHRLHTLAAVRNLVTHRAAASGATLDAFRKSYYLSFEDLAQMA